MELLFFPRGKSPVGDRGGGDGRPPAGPGVKVKEAGQKMAWGQGKGRWGGRQESEPGEKGKKGEGKKGEKGKKGKK